MVTSGEGGVLNAREIKQHRSWKVTIGFGKKEAVDTVSWSDGGRSQTEAGQEWSWSFEVMSLSGDLYFKKVHSHRKERKHGRQRKLQTLRKDFVYFSTE